MTSSVGQKYADTRNYLLVYNSVVNITAINHTIEQERTLAKKKNNKNVKHKNTSVKLMLKLRPKNCY